MIVSILIRLKYFNAFVAFDYVAYLKFFVDLRLF